MEENFFFKKKWPKKFAHSLFAMDITINAINKAKSSLPKLGDADKESDYGVVYSVSGPGMLFLNFYI